MFLLQIRTVGFSKIISGPLPLKINIIIIYQQNIDILIFIYIMCIMGLTELAHVGPMSSIFYYNWFFYKVTPYFNYCTYVK